jgi:hypothetical protein
MPTFAIIQLRIKNANHALIVLSHFRQGTAGVIFNSFKYPNNG